MKTHLLLFTLILLAACGGVNNATNPQPAPPEDPSPATTMLGSDAAIPAGDTAVVFNSSFTDPIGNIASISLGDPTVAALARITTDGSDAIVRSFGGRIYIINRLGTDTIQVIDPATFGVVANYSVGQGSNPQDIVVVSDEKAYISRLDAQGDADTTDDILIVNPLTGAALGSINLTPFTANDAERLARAAQMVLVGTQLFVCMQDLPANMLLSADTNGKVAVIDTETDAVTKVIELAGRNPSDITYSPLTKKLYVADTGVYVNFIVDTSDANGGIEVIDGETLESEGIVIDDASLGGGVAEVRLASEALGYTIVGSTKVASFNPTSYAVVNAGVYQSPASFLPDISIDQEGRLLVAEQDFNNPGVVFVSTDGTVVAGPTGVGAPPVSITFVEIP